MTFYVCKQCNYKHTFLPVACTKCKGTNFYPLVTSEPTGNTSVCNGMEIQKDVLKLRIEHNRLAQQLEQSKEIIQNMLRAIPNRMWYSDETIKQAEAFLKEIEK